MPVRQFAPGDTPPTPSPTFPKMTRDQLIPRFDPSIRSLAHSLTSKNETISRSRSITGTNTDTDPKSNHKPISSPTTNTSGANSRFSPPPRNAATSARGQKEFSSFQSSHSTQFTSSSYPSPESNSTSLRCLNSRLPTSITPLASTSAFTHFQPLTLFSSLVPATFDHSVTNFIRTLWSHHGGRFQVAKPPTKSLWVFRRTEKNSHAEQNHTLYFTTPGYANHTPSDAEAGKGVVVLDAEWILCCVKEKSLLEMKDFMLDEFSRGRRREVKISDEIQSSHISPSSVSWGIMNTADHSNHSLSSLTTSTSVVASTMLTLPSDSLDNTITTSSPSLTNSLHPFACFLLSPCQRSLTQNRTPPLVGASPSPRMISSSSFSPGTQTPPLKKFKELASTGFLFASARDGDDDREEKGEAMRVNVALHSIEGREKNKTEERVRANSEWRSDELRNATEDKRKKEKKEKEKGGEKENEKRAVIEVEIDTTDIVGTDKGKEEIRMKEETMEKTVDSRKRKRIKVNNTTSPGLEWDMPGLVEALYQKNQHVDFKIDYVHSSLGWIVDVKDLGAAQCPEP